MTTGDCAVQTSDTLGNRIYAVAVCIFNEVRGTASHKDDSKLSLIHDGDQTC